nr:NXPE family member 3-like [Lytechinus pictus]
MGNARKFCVITSSLMLVVLVIVDQFYDYHYLNSSLTSGFDVLAIRFKIVDHAPAPLAQSSSDGRKKHPLCPGRTARTFPQFSYPSVHPINWTNHMDITNHTMTTFELVSPKETYFICDEIELRVHARNGRNESKKYGGDLFRAKIFTKNSTYSASSSSDGEIVDHGNGTYSAYFTLKWTGIISISVSLIVPSEASYVLDRIRAEHQPRIAYFGGFVSSNKSEKEGFCNVQLRKPMNETEYCNFTDAATKSPWFCEKPTGFRCSEWKKHRIDGRRSEQQALELINQTEREAFQV